ncbi:CopG family transcriptional regulator [Sphingomonas sp. ABOLE]|uniref:CopG family ribbon-helix-helix protein n=1 Tax=Sphingomonas sp. ABOLE TaxID=1985878 RepID=UPI000F7E872A|nr:CopG family transcriptional regulator [Sphingomonas sp. ABOLE]RSV44834.1 CopG family transcriptional regulator [Sphingomonas sp. ABOLE]
MNKRARITAELSAETLAMVEEIAAWQGRSAAEFAAEAIQRVAETESDYRAFIQEGLDAADRGDVVPHAQVMAELDAMIERHRQRCRS